MLFESIISSFVVGKLRKRKIMNIADVEMKGWYLFIIAVFLEISSNLLVAFNKSSFSSFIENYFLYIHFISYTLVFIGLYLNKDKVSMKILFAGAFLNFICIMANNGHMPISLDAAKFAGLISQDISNPSFDLTHTLLNSGTKLKLLCDIIALPKQYIRPKVLSIGDVLIAVGIFVFIQEAMKGKQGKVQEYL